MPSKSNCYATLIGDLVNSKEITNREAFQNKLAAKLKKLSKKNAALTSPLTITLGDEFQAVFNSGESLIQCLFEIRATLYPVKCRFSIGIGPLSTRINTRQAIGMDGPAFHLARDGIDTLKKNENLLLLAGLSPEYESHLIAIYLLWESTYKWNRSRLLILIGLLEGKKEKMLKSELNISERAIYKNIESANLNEWVTLIRHLEDLISLELAK